MSKKLLPIEMVAKKIGLKSGDLEFYGKYKAKIVNIPKKNIKSNLVLVTAMTPGKFGEGKTTTSIGLSQALWRLNKKNIVVLREPSLGPCFGMKGGATGGGKAMVEPSDEINYHFTGDIHAITYAHNLLSSMIDNSLYFDNPLNLDKDTISWPRVLDLNDRVLRNIHIKMSKKNGEIIERDTRFDISVTSEVMAILCLSKDIKDLKSRLENIVIGFDKNGKPVTAKMLKAANAMTALLKDAIKPNLVQTTEGTPAIIHGGPFANIAHGTASLIAIKTSLRLAPYTIVEAGFAADLGGEKFLDIICRLGGIHPKIAVLITTTRAVLESGLENVHQHVKNMQRFGLNVVVCVNRFKDDDINIVNKIRDYCLTNNLPVADSFAFEKGGQGTIELAKEVIMSCKKTTNSSLRFTYDLNDTPLDKIKKLATEVYGAKNVQYSDEAKKQLSKLGKLCRNNFICMAKTQYSFSHDPNLKGAPRNYTFNIREVRLAAGAGFLIPVAGEMMTMPGLPRHPLAETIE